MSQITISQLHEITGLGRPIDPSLRSNRNAIVGATLAGGMKVLFSWLSTGDFGLLGAASVGAGVFLAWALVREISPDNESASYLAMVFAGLVGLISSPAALITATLLLAVRALSGTVGSPIRTFDLIVLGAASAYAGAQPVGWPIVALLAFAAIRSGHKNARIAALGITVAGVSSAAFFANALAPAVLGMETLALLGFLVIVGWRKIRDPQIESRADSGSPITPSRVGLGRLATLLAIGAGSLLAPESALTDLAPAIAAFTAMGIWTGGLPSPEVTRDEPIAALEARVPVAI